MLKIRPFQWSDADALCERNNEPEVLENRIGHSLESVEETVKYFSDFIEEGGIVLVAERDGQTVGNIEVKIGKGECSHIGTVGLAVKKEFWGNRIGTELVKAAISESKRMGLKKLVYTARDSNDRSTNLARHSGFKRVGKMRKHIFSGGKYHDRLIFEKLL